MLNQMQLKSVLFFDNIYVQYSKEYYYYITEVSFCNATIYDVINVRIFISV